MSISGTTSQDPDGAGDLPEDAAADQQGGLVDADGGAQFDAAVEQRLADGQNSGSTTGAQTGTEDDKTNLPVLEEEEDSPVKPQNS
ncbi:hypothetical protein [Kocuria sp. NPDC057446]|uniref:hypothetical protein n=1 Tax=Kocuria sp. NPDC057446 TaxID=3346137 RepID=UPI00369E1FD7